MRKTFQPIALSLMVFISHFSLNSAAFAEGGGMLEEMKKVKPGDNAAIEKLKYKYYYKSKIDKLNAMSDRNRAATKKEDEAIAKLNREEAAKGKTATPAAKSESVPTKSAAASASPAATGFRKAQKTSDSGSSSAPIKVDSDAPDELSFPGKDED